MERLSIDEVIGQLKYMYKTCMNEKCKHKGQCDLCCDARDMAIQALEEIQQYRAIGTIEEFKRAKEMEAVYGQVKWERDVAISQLEEIGVALGQKMEEFKALKEKSVAKKPKYQKIQYGKHKWKRKENGEIDDFAWDYAYCNGVVCEVCGETQCVHCNPKYDKLKNCEVEDYFCPTCNETVGYFYSHCKHCWQKLDWE